MGSWRERDGEEPANSARARACVCACVRVCDPHYFRCRALLYFSFAPNMSSHDMVPTEDQYFSAHPIALKIGATFLKVAAILKADS